MGAGLFCTDFLAPLDSGLSSLYIYYMSKREMSLSETRAALTDLVNRAQYAGETTIITRHGKPAARITPLEDTMETNAFTFAVEISDDGATWMAENDAAIGTEYDHDGTAQELAEAVLDNRLADLAADGRAVEPGRIRVLVWKGEETRDREFAAATAERPEAGAGESGTAFTLVSAAAGDEVPGVEIGDPESPIGWTELAAADRRWAEAQGYGEDDSELLYILAEGAEVPAGMAARRVVLGAAAAEVYWSVVEGQSPGTTAVEPQEAGVEVPDEVMEWAAGHGFGEDNPDNIYLLVTDEDHAQADVQGEVAWKATRTSRETAAAVAAAIEGEDPPEGRAAPSMTAAHLVECDAATAEWLTGAMTGLAANGLRPTVENDGRVRLPEGAAAWLAETTTEDDDGHVILADDGTVLLWVEGEPYTLVPEV